MLQLCKQYRTVDVNISDGEHFGPSYLSIILNVKSTVPNLSDPPRAIKFYTSTLSLKGFITMYNRLHKMTIT